MPYPKEQYKLAKTILVEAQTSEKNWLLDKDFKITVLHMLKELKETMDKEWIQIRTMKYKQNENTNKERDYKKKPN